MDAQPPLDACTREREALAERRASLDFAPDCLALLRGSNDLSFVKRIRVATVYLSAGAAAVDLSPLVRLHELREVALRLVPLPRLEALAQLSSLESLRIETVVESADVLAPLTHLRTLSIEPFAAGKMTNVAAFSGLHALEELVIREAVDLGALAQAAPNLRVLVAPSAQELPSLSGFANLESFTVGCLDEPELRLPCPPKLRSLGISCYDGTTSLRPIADCTQLEELDISETNVDSPAPLGSLTRLRRLDAHQTNLRSVSALRACRALEWVDVHSSQVQSVESLAGLPRLQFLDIGDTPVRSVASLAASRSLESLWLPGSQVASVAPLAGLKTLKEVMVPRDCGRADVLRLHAVRPDVRVMAWVEKSRSEDPGCF